MKKMVSFLLCSQDKSDLDCFKLEKYMDLANYLMDNNLSVNTITWKRDNIEDLYKLSKDTDAVLVWVNPVDRDIETGYFEKYLRDMKDQGKYVSSQPDAVIKIGTKKVLFELSGTRWSSNTFLHENESTFIELEERLNIDSFRVLKQHRGNDGIGVYKVGRVDKYYIAKEAHTNKELIFNSFDDMKNFLIGNFNISINNPIIETKWNNNLVNGVIRCYFCNKTVAGFGYQEINSLYPDEVTTNIKKQRFYLTENCGIFKGIRGVIETEFIDDILVNLEIDQSTLPLIWDADFFINDLAKNDIELCEINASCVSPFPPSAIKYIHKEIEKNLKTALFI